MIITILYSLAQIKLLSSKTAGPELITDPSGSTSQESIFGFISDSTLFLLLEISLAIFLTGLGLVYLYLRRVKQVERDKKSLDYTLYLVRVPRDNETPIKAMEQLYASLYGLYKKRGVIERLMSTEEGVSFEIIAYPDYIGFFVYVPKKYAHFVEKQILGAYQGAEVVEAEEPNIFREDAVVACGEFSLEKESFYPIKTYKDYEEKSDPLSNIVGSFANMTQGEGAGLQVLVVPTDLKWAGKGQKKLKSEKALLSDPEKKAKPTLTQAQTEAIERKTQKVGFKTYVRVVAAAPSEAVAYSRLTAISGAFMQFANPGINGFKFKRINGSKLKEFMEDFIYRRVPEKSKGMILNVEELATLYHFPNKVIETPGIDWLMSKKGPAPKDLPTSGLWIGTATYRGQKKPVYIGSIDDRRRHMYIVGQTGVGKSYFMANMILQDIYAGRGVAVLDPHGSLAEEILRRVPPERAEDVIYFNPADTERPIGLNILEHKSEFEKHEIVNSFLALMKKLFDPHDQGIVGPRFERAVRMAMLTVMVEPDSTLIEVLRAIADEEYAKSFLPKVKDTEVRLFYEKELARTDKFHKSEILGWITSKFDRFVTNLLIRNIIGQSKSSFDIRKVMDEGKILLVNLSQGLIGIENAQFLGLLIVPKIMRAALSREDTPEDMRRDFFLYVDEFQNFATEDFAKILSEARKYRLSLILANQYITQIGEKVRDAIFGNVGNLVAFRVGRPEDAEFLEKTFAPVFTKEDLLHLENANAYVKLLINGKSSEPFSMSTWYNMEKRFPKYPKVAHLIKQLSRIRYGRPIEQVNKDIERRARRTNVPSLDSTPEPLPPLGF